jgi:AGZA family xanthine/uracil permease-like MFS transporter
MFKINSHIKTEITAGFSIFFSVWTISFLYGQVMQNFGFSQTHWFSNICIIASLGCLLSFFIIKQPFMIAPGLSTGWFFCHLLNEHTNPKTLFLAISISGIVLLLLSRLKLIKQTKQFLPESIQETINIGIGFLFIRIALGQQFPELNLCIFQQVSSYLFFFTIACLLMFKQLKMKSGMLLTVIMSVGLAYLLKCTSWQGLFAVPEHIQYVFSLPDTQHIKGLILTKHVLEISLFSLFDTAVGVFCLQQLQITLRAPCPPSLSPSYVSVGLNNIFSGLLLCGPNTAYIESTIGIQLGARRALSILVVSLCFAGFLFCLPIGSMIPKELFRGILFFIGCSLITPLYKMRYKTPTANILSIALIFIMIIRKSIMDGLMVSIFAMVIYNRLNHIKTESVIEWSAVLSLIILLLRFV